MLLFNLVIIVWKWRAPTLEEIFVVRDRRGFIRRTKQREVILSVLQSTDTHPSADWIYEEVRQVLPNISLGTIYRNLRILVDSGEAMELRFGSGASRFDGNPKNHYHFVCLNCDRIYDLELSLQEKLEEQVSEKAGHRVLDHRLEFYGICDVCQSKKNTIDEPRHHDS
ncbi:MAG: transcriptional repressor [Firmicutes bacterium]|nr:transcriptional repressor [Bacillota bacterium]